jgi:sec-independent protein translocase protein TatA
VFDAILQPTHLIVILVVVLIVLGPKRLPGAGRALGQGLREFKASIGGHRSEEP